MYYYETHLHTSPVSKCARKSVRENVEYYKSIGYDGIFITNHFLDGYIDVDPSLPYEDRIQFYFSDYEEGKKIGDEIGLKVFCGVELSYNGTDFLIYGLGKEWFLAHPEIEGMKKSDELKLMRESGALVVQAHPYREAIYIDHIRLYPRDVEAVEIFNASRPDFESDMAKLYAKHYGLIPFAGSDNHSAAGQRILGGMCCEFPIENEAHFIENVRNGNVKPFRKDLDK